MRPTKLQKLLAADNRASEEWVKEVAKLKRLAGRKTLKAATTKALQVALEGAQFMAWEQARVSMSSFLQPVFAEVYEDFMLSTGYKLVWKDKMVLGEKKKQMVPTLLGFNFTQALRYVTYGMRQDKCDTMVLQICRELVVGTKLEEADVYVADGKILDNFGECDMDLIGMLENSGTVRQYTAGTLLSENHLHRNIKINAVPISKIMYSEELHSVFDKSGCLLPEGYQWLWSKIRKLCVDKFNQKLEEKILETAPLYATNIPKIASLYTPRKISNTRSAFKHVVKATIVGENGEHQEVSKPAIPTAETLQRIKEKLTERPKSELR
jgi:hypothetical protein